MRITRLYINGFKRLISFDLPLNERLTVIVGDNETGKSSVLEALALVLSRQYDGRTIDHALDPYLFNAAIVRDYFKQLRNGKTTSPPHILIEAYFNDGGDDPSLARLKGTNNTKSEDCPGLSLGIDVDSNYVEALKEYARDPSSPAVLPVEFYRVTWRAFSGEAVTLRSLPFRPAVIDTNLPRVYRGPNKYVVQVVNDVLSEEQRRELSLAYKRLRHEFTQQPGVTAINQHLATQGNPATKRI